MEAKVELKELPPKKRIQYIWDYYKWWILGGLFAIYMLTSSIYQYATAKEQLLQLILVNGSVSYTEVMFAEDYLEAEGYPSDKYELIASTVEFKMTETSYQQDYYTLQSLIARLTSGDIDVFAAPADIFATYGTEGYLLDLRDIFTKEELTSYEKYLVYTTDPVTATTYPCAFDFTNHPWITKHNYYSDSCQFGILYNCSNVEQAKRFLSFILNY